MVVEYYVEQTHHIICGKYVDIQSSSKHQGKLWDMFDTEINGKTHTNSQLERIYSNSQHNQYSGNREVCERCHTTLFFSEEGFLTCSNSKCGIVYTDLVDQSPEWRFYGGDDGGHATDPSRCGMPINPMLEESSFGCRVLCGTNTSHDMWKIRRYTETLSMPHRERSLYNEFQRLTAYAQNAGFSKKIINTAIYYHNKLSVHEQTFRGDNKEGILIGAMSIACKVNKSPRTAKELATAFYVDASVATRGCKLANAILNKLENENSDKDKTQFSKTRPSAFIERYCSKVKINAELTKLCMFIANKIDKYELMPENTPHAIAAGIVFFVAQVCNLTISKKDVKSISEISEVTITKCYNKMENMIHDLIPLVILAKYNPSKPGS